MIGIPLLLIAILTAFSNKRNAAVLWGMGTFFQFLGHFLFEKNIPTLIETRDPMTIPASLIFTAGEFKQVFEGKWLEKNGLELWTKQPSNINDVVDADSWHVVKDGE